MNDQRTPIEEETLVVKRSGIQKAAPVQDKPVTEADRIGDRKEELNPEDRSGRPVRIPIGTSDRLAFPARRGYVRRVVNDIDDGERIKRFQAAGYTIVDGNVTGGDTRAGADSQLGARVVRSVGGGIKGVLMEIPEEFYNEDQANKLNMVQETEESIRRKAEENEFYGKVTIERKHGK